MSGAVGVHEFFRRRQSAAHGALPGAAVVPFPGDPGSLRSSNHEPVSGGRGPGGIGRDRAARAAARVSSRRQGAAVLNDNGRQRRRHASASASVAHFRCQTTPIPGVTCLHCRSQSPSLAAPAAPPGLERVAAAVDTAVATAPLSTWALARTP